MIPVRYIAAWAGVALAAAGCATTRVNVEWTDPEFKGRSLRGAKVLVVCDAPDVAMQRVCQDQLAARLRAAGAEPVVSANAGLTAGPPPTNDATLVAARGAGAKAIFGATIGPDVTVVSGGPAVSIGVGGWGGSGGGTVIGSGVGIGFPIGGGQASTGYAANMVLTDAATVKLMWSSKVTSPASQNLSAQMGELARVGVEAAQKAGFF